MQIKFEPKADITVFELALILKTTQPFVVYAICPKDVWDNNFPPSVRRHFDCKEDS